jgi:hypothetical protein
VGRALPGQREVVQGDDRPRDCRRRWGEPGIGGVAAMCRAVPVLHGGEQSSQQKARAAFRADALPASLFLSNPSGAGLDIRGCAEGLRPKQKRRFRPPITDSAHNDRIAENWLAKVPTPDRPGQLWQSDITHIETAEGWLYLAFTLDACSRRVIAHHCREDLFVELTTTTFDLAATRQRPPAGLIHHSDRVASMPPTLSSSA